jgi:hypothetical protein
LGSVKKEIISNRDNYTKYWVTLDIHDIPAGIDLDQKTRVIRMVKSSLSPKLEISRKRKFEDIANLMTIEELSNHFVLSGRNCDGRRGTNDELRGKVSECNTPYVCYPYGTESTAALVVRF